MLEEISTEEPELKPGTEHGFKAVGCGCKSHYCESCSRGLGLKLRAKLVEAIQGWQASIPVMVTLTIDPKIFDSPAEEMDFVRKKSLISQLIRELKRRGFLTSPNYFGVIEFQENGWPHWHVLIDSSFLPIAAINSIWQGYGPAREGSTVDMGFVWISKGTGSKNGKFHTKEHAAHYVTKYIIKPPKNGFPAWVLNRKGVIFKRYTTNKGCFASVGKPPVFSTELLGYPSQWDIEDEQDEKRKSINVAKLGKKYKRTADTIAGRVANCGNRTIVVEFEDTIKPDGEVVSRRQWKFRLDIDLQNVGMLLGREPEDNKLLLSAQELLYLKGVHEYQESRERLKERVRFSGQSDELIDITEIEKVQATLFANDTSTLVGV